MRVICPYCGKSQDGRNDTCQFCQAKLPSEFEPDPAIAPQGGPGAPAEAEQEPETALCEVCMRSFPSDELEEYEGHRVCKDCRQKIKRRDTSMAPAMKKVKEEEGPRVRPGRRFAAIFIVGLLLIAGAAFGGFQAWKAVARTRAQVLYSARERFEPIIDQSNQAFVILIQKNPDDKLLAHAANLLDACVKELDAPDIRNVCGDFPPLETFRLGMEEVVLTRLSCTRTLTGRRTGEDPVNAAQARQRLTETQEQAVEIISQLVKDLRLYGLEAEGLIFY